MSRHRHQTPLRGTTAVPRPKPGDAAYSVVNYAYAGQTGHIHEVVEIGGRQLAWEVSEFQDERRVAVLMLTRAYEFKDFKDAMAFAVRVGDIAEEQQHHPDLHVAWREVRVDIWTHNIGGLTESDGVFAAKCDAL